MTTNDKLAAAYGVPDITEYYSCNGHAQNIELQHDTLRLFQLCSATKKIQITFYPDTVLVVVRVDKTDDFDFYDFAEKYTAHKSEEHAVRRAMVLALAKQADIEVTE